MWLVVTELAFVTKKKVEFWFQDDKFQGESYKDFLRMEC